MSILLFISTFTEVCTWSFIAWIFFRVYEGALADNAGDQDRSDIKRYLEESITMATLLLAIFSISPLTNFLLYSSVLGFVMGNILLECYMIHKTIPNMLSVACGVIIKLQIPLISELLLNFRINTPQSMLMSKVDLDDENRRKNKAKMDRVKNQKLFIIVSYISRNMPSILYYSMFLMCLREFALSYSQLTVPISAITLVCVYVLLALNLSDEQKLAREELFKSTMYIYMLSYSFNLFAGKVFFFAILQILHIPSLHVTQGLRTLLLKIPAHSWLRFLTLANEYSVKQSKVKQPLEEVYKIRDEIKSKKDDAYEELLDQIRKISDFSYDHARGINEKYTALRSLYQINTEKFKTVPKFNDSDPRVLAGQDTDSLNAAMQVSTDRLVGYLNSLDSNFKLEYNRANTASDQESTRDEIVEIIKQFNQRISIGNEANFNENDKLRSCFVTVCNLVSEKFEEYSSMSDDNIIEKQRVFAAFKNRLIDILREEDVCANGLYEGFINLYKQSESDTHSLDSEIEYQFSVARSVNAMRQYMRLKTDDKTSRRFSRKSNIFDEIGRFIAKSELTSSETDRHELNKFQLMFCDNYRSEDYVTAQGDLNMNVSNYIFTNAISTIHAHEFHENAVESYLDARFGKLSSSLITDACKDFVENEVPESEFITFVREFVFPEEFDKDIGEFFDSMSGYRTYLSEFEEHEAYKNEVEENLEAILYNCAERLLFDDVSMETSAVLVALENLRKNSFLVFKMSFIYTDEFVEKCRLSVSIQKCLKNVSLLAPNESGKRIDFDSVRRELSDDVTDEQIGLAYCRSVYLDEDLTPEAKIAKIKEADKGFEYNRLTGEWHLNGKNIEVISENNQDIKNIAFYDKGFSVHVMLQKLLQQGHIIRHSDIERVSYWTLLKSGIKDCFMVVVDVYNLSLYAANIFYRLFSFPKLKRVFTTPVVIERKDVDLAMSGSANDSNRNEPQLKKVN